MKTLNRIILAALAAFSISSEADSLLIRGATVHTMAGDGVLENTDVLIVDGKVERIGSNLRVRQDELRVVEAGGKPVTPGLFAGISSIGITEVSAVEESTDSSLDLKHMHPEFDVAPAYNPHSTLVPVARIEGFAFTLLGAGTKGSLFEIGRAHV